MKPMLAGEAVIERLRYPLVASPKLDGIRGLVHESKLLARSLKLIPNRHVQTQLARSHFNGIDGELILGEPTAKDVYRKTLSAVMKHDGAPGATYYVFDMHTPPQIPYYRRREKLTEILGKTPKVGGNVNIVLLEQREIKNVTELLNYETFLLNAGFEGVILRDPDTGYKYGRSSTKEGILLKLKRFSDAEAIVIGFEEEMENTNEATTNELGRTKRSSAKAGLKGKDTLGALVCRDLASGVEFKIGSGFDQAEKLHVWERQALYKDQIVKYKSFKIGVKDAPRHPVFLGWRDRRDM